MAKNLGKRGVRVIAELPWGPGLIPDQTVLGTNSVWAVEHHLHGPFTHQADYCRFMEEEVFTLCHWWRPGVQMGLLVLTPSAMVERVRAVLKRSQPSGLTCRVTSPAAVIDPGPWLSLPGRLTAPTPGTGG